MLLPQVSITFPPLIITRAYRLVSLTTYHKSFARDMYKNCKGDICATKTCFHMIGVIFNYNLIFVTIPFIFTIF